MARYFLADGIAWGFLSLSDDEALPRSLDDGFALECFDFENSFYLSEETVKQPEVAAGDSDDGRDRLLI